MASMGGYTYVHPRGLQTSYGLRPSKNAAPASVYTVRSVLCSPGVLGYGYPRRRTSTMPQIVAMIRSVSAIRHGANQ